MRIEVEVYKGPLSKDPHSQWGELLGLVREARVSLRQLAYATARRAIDKNAINVRNDDAFLKAVLEANRTGFRAQFLPGVSSRDDADAHLRPCRKQVGEVPKVRFPGWTIDKGERCGDYIGLLDSYFELHQRLSELESEMCFVRSGPIQQQHPIACEPSLSRQRPIVELLTEAAEISSRAHFKAFYWAASELGDDDDKGATRDLVDGVNLFSNLANQVSSRADRLLLQIAGTDRKHLPLSVYLREVEPTDFNNLYDWQDARSNKTDAVNDIRVIERLFADSNWAKINTVYASGQGDVAMAFIKDDIGNWNLKAFKNDPSELLQAYTDFTLNSISKAAELVKTISTGGIDEGASQALTTAIGLASRASAGSIGGGEIAAANVNSLRTRASGQLAVLYGNVKTERDRLVDLIVTAQSKAVTAKQEADMAELEASKTLPPVGTQSSADADREVGEAETATIRSEITLTSSPLTKDEKTGSSVRLEKAQNLAFMANKHREDAPPLEASDPNAAATLRERAVKAAREARLWATAADKQLALANANKALGQANGALASYRTEVIESVRDILENHLAVLDVVTEMQISRSSEQQKLPSGLPANLTGNVQAIPK